MYPMYHADDLQIYGGFFFSSVRSNADSIHLVYCMVILKTQLFDQRHLDSLNMLKVSCIV